MTLFAFIKIMYGGVFQLYQGKKALDLFRGIYMSYVHAETGKTYGIVMNERKSKQIKEHANTVWRITAAQILIVFVGCIMLRKELDNVSHKFIDNIFSNSTAHLNATSDSSELSFGQSLDLYKKLYNDKSGIKVNHPTAAPVPVKTEASDDDSWFEWSPPANSPYSVTYKADAGSAVIERKDWIVITKSMTKQQALDMAKMMTAIISLCLFGFFATVTLTCQAAYMYYTHHAHHHQE